MALFKILRGSSENFTTDLTQSSVSPAFHDGYCYFIVDTGLFYVDYENNGNRYRIPLNAGDAKTLLGATLEHDVLRDSEVEIPSSALLYAVKNAIDESISSLEARKANKITGLPNQLVSFDDEGNFIAKDNNSLTLKNLTDENNTGYYIYQNDEDVTAETLEALKHTHDEYLTEQVQADLSQTDFTQPDYVKGIIRRESLPKGFPYKDNAIVLDVTQHFKIGRMFEFTCENVLNADTIYNVTITAPNGSVKKESINTEYSSDGTMINFTIKLNDYYNCNAIFNYYVDSNVLGIVFRGPAQTSDGIFTVNVEAPVEIHRMSAEYLPEGVVIGDIDVYWEDIKDKPFGVAAIKTGTEYNTVNLTTIITPGEIVNGNMYQGIAKYIVIFDGEYFECDSVLKGSGPSGIAYCGNLSLCGAGSDNGLPFCLKAARTSSYTECYVADPSVKHTIEAFQGYLGIKYLDDKYISDNIARKAYVDEMLGQVQDRIDGLTAEDVGALPADTVIPSIEGLASETYVDEKISVINTSIDNKYKVINKKISSISKTITEQDIDTAFNDIFGGE